MDTLIVAVAQGGIALIAIGALAAWWTLSGPGKLRLAVQAVVALVVALVLIKVAAGLHTDPRPFVVDPHLKPLFAHGTDNGFPSDHTAISMTVAGVVLAYRRKIGVALVVLALAIGAARVLAHVHHVQDIVAGAVIGLLAAAIGLYVGGLIVSRVETARASRGGSRRKARSTQ